MPPQRRKRGPYKNYLRDPNAEVPRSTLWLRRQQEREINDIPVEDEIQVIDQDNIAEAAHESVSCEVDEMSQHSAENDSTSEVDEMPQHSPDNNSTVSSVHEADVQPCEEISAMEASAPDSDTLDNEDNDSDCSSDLEEDLRVPVAIESSDEDGDVQDNLDDLDNDVGLHFGDGGNIINPNVLNWDNGHEDENEADARQPLYEGAQISPQESDILIMSFIIRWGLEEKGIEHLLRLLDCHMPTAILGSRHMFLKKFDVGPSLKMRYFCHECPDILPIEDEDGQMECTCGFEGNIKDLRRDDNCFVHLPISEQIQQVLSNRDLVRQMRKECPESDVVSGNIYKRLRAREVIGENDITLQWNTDGVKPFKSSKVTMWPILACINELPPLARRDNMLLCGLYYGKTKPDTNVILKLFVDELQTLHSVGMNCNIAGRGEHLVKVHPLICSVDSVARAPLQGLMQYNSAFGCSFCLLRSTSVVRGRGFAQVYDGDLGTPRTSDQHLLALRTLENYNATHNGQMTNVEGVKRGSVLMLLPVFHIIKSFVPDYMHAALEGVVVMFWKHWCSSDYDGELWHLSRAKRRALNAKLESILPPVEVTRPPRTLDDIKLWKASEMKSFLLYYSLPSLKGLLPNKYLRHWFLFVYSMTIFLREKIEREDFCKAQHALAKFVHDIRAVYPNCNYLYTFNTHLLLHFPKAVQSFGALWSSSTFPFEHYNGVLTRLIKGTQSVPMQICRSFVRLRRVSNLSSTVFSRENCSELGKSLYNSMLSKYASSHSHLYCEGLRLFGSPEMYSLSLVDRVSIERLLNKRVEITARSFRRMILRGTVFHSSVYGSLSVRDNSIAQMNDGAFVSIQRIILVRIFNSQEVFCVILSELLQSVNQEICGDNDLAISSSDIVHVCRRSDRIVTFIPQNIQNKCVGVPFGNDVCVIPMVNVIERD